MKKLVGHNTISRKHLTKPVFPLIVLVGALIVFACILAGYTGLGIKYYVVVPSSTSSLHETKFDGGNQNTVCVVLGEMLLLDGTATPNLYSRIKTAKRFVAKFNVKHVILSGGDTAKVNKTEASFMKEIWDRDQKAKSMRSTIFDLEEESLSTCQNAFFVIPILQRIGADRIILVTSEYHVPRAKLLFEQVFRTNAPDLVKVELIAYAANTFNKYDRSELFTNERYWLQEEPLRRLLTNMTEHPFYLPTAQRIQQARDELNYLE